MRGIELKRWRQAIGIRQNELAEGLGVHRNKVWGWESRDVELPRWAVLATNQLLSDGRWIETIKGERRVKKGLRRLDRFEAAGS